MPSAISSVRYGKVLASFFWLVAVLTLSAESMSEPLSTSPFEVDLDVVHNLTPGETVSISVVKTGGSEEMRGFDFMISYDNSELTLTDIVPGPIFDIPGDLEWEYIDFPLPPYENCETGCPSGMIEVFSIADITGSGHHPLIDPQTGRIKVVPDGTVLVTVEFEIDPLLPPSVTEIPVSFFWNSCASNGIAFTYRDGAELDVKQANSSEVYSFDGQSYVEITDTTTPPPSYFGMEEDCLPYCGDTNGDDIRNILDITFLIAYKFLDGPAPYPLVVADVNGDHTISILDIIYYVDFKFKGGPEPACPETNKRFVTFRNGGIFKTTP